MSLKQEIETWVQALAHYDNNEFEEALHSFDDIAETSKIFFNCGVIHATLGEHGKAVECYQRAVRLDQYLAVAYFQQGVSNFLVGDFEEALANFNDTLLYLRGNTFIDYEQLGLKFKLYSCEVLFNRGLCYIYLQQKDAGLQDFTFALKEKATDDHNVIDEAIREEAEGYTVFSIPVGILYRPNESKVKNLKTKDYLGKARLVAASDRSNAFTGFAGTEIKKEKEAQADLAARDDRPSEAISFAASNLVKPELRSRARQQSEPPMNRQVFPPTPPPEADRMMSPISPGENSDRSMTGRAASVRGAGSRPDRLDFSRTREEPPRRQDDFSKPYGGFDRPQRAETQRPDGPRAENAFERPRLGTSRTASESRVGNVARTYSRSRNADNFGPPGRRETERVIREEPRGEEEESYPGNLYDMYQGPPPPRKNSAPAQRSMSAARPKPKPRYIEEEAEPASDYEGSSVDEGDFEMMPRPSRQASRKRVSKKAVTKIRIKTHFGGDTRYIMIGAAIEYLDFLDRVADKFGLRGQFKCCTQDEGDMITIGDQDDLEMAISTCTAYAKQEGADMGKMEIWVEEL